MSVCTSEKELFYVQDAPFDEKHSKCNSKHAMQSKQLNEFHISKLVNPKSDDIVKNIVPQDENDYANQKYALEDIFIKQKPVLSRKREAGNILMECVKRRDNLKNIDFSSNVPFSWGNICNCNSTLESEAGSCRYHNEKHSTVKNICSYDLEPLTTMDTCISSPIVDRGLDNALNRCTSGQCTEDIYCMSCQKNNFKDYMDVDYTAEIPTSKKNSCFMESGSHNSSVSDVSSQCSASSVAIYEDLNCLHLTDESVLLSTTKAQPVSVIKAPIIPSLFQGVSSAIYFATNGEKVMPMPSDVRQLMKWKLSTITPTLIRETVTKSGFILVNGEKTDEWIGTWGKHMKCATFKGVKNFQKVNHFPGSFHLGRKDKLWDNYRRMQSRHGKNAFYFLPDTFILPTDMRLLKQAWDYESTDKYWIIKPPASARGTGIKVIHKWSQVPKNRPVVVQRYISDPYLINGTKFDLRVYVLVPSIDPLRIYIFDDGLVRFASEKYLLSNQTFSNRYMHLTNYSINRKSSSYTANEDGNTCQGHKWTLKSFWIYLSNNGVDVTKIKESIVDMVIKTILCAEGPIFRLMKTYAKSSYNCFELFGFDIMLDKSLQPWLLEVNISPSLHTRSMLDSTVKGQLVKDMLNIASFEVPETNRIADSNSDYGILSPVAHKHKALRNRYLTLEERNKHSYYTLEHCDEQFDILDNLTPDDLRCLIESEDECNRKGSFIRVFPSETSSKYFIYFEHKRYYNFLLDAWEKCYSQNREKGISLLQSMCERKLHLQMICKETVLKHSTIPGINSSNSAVVEVKDS